MRHLLRNIYQNLLGNIPKSAKLPLWFWLLSYSISNLQITFIILQPLQNSHPGLEFKVFKIIQQAASITTGLGMINTSIWYTSMVEIGFYLLLLYLLILLLSCSYIVFISKGNRKLSSFFAKTCSIIYLIHSKVLFFPVFYFLLQFASEYSDLSQCFVENQGNNIQCKAAYFIITILLCLINVLIAVFAEFTLYKVKTSKHGFSSKNNVYFQAALCYKMVIPILNIMSENTEKLSYILGLIWSLLYFYAVIRKLCFNNVFALKLNLIFGCSHFAFLAILTFTSFGLLQKDTELLLFLAAAVTTLVSFKILHQKLIRILQLDFQTPDEAVHVLALLKTITLKMLFLNQFENKYHEGSLYLIGLLKFNNKEAPLENLSSNDKVECNHRLYSIVVKSLNNLKKKFPHSQELTLVIAQIYIKKLNNTARGVTLLMKLSENCSIQIHSAIQEIYTDLKRHYYQAYREEDFEFSNYFNLCKMVSAIKLNIQTETSQHETIWKELASETINVKKVVDLSEQIDQLYIKNKKSWKEFLQVSQKEFTAPFLMYSTYLEIVRANFYEANKSIQKYYELKKTKHYSTKINSPFNNDVAIILASVESQKPGVIIDASASVSSLFRITKEKLVGDKINCLLPRIAARQHDDLIKNYTKQKENQYVRSFETIAKTIDGDFFPVSISLKIYPHMERGLNLLSCIRKTQPIEFLLMLDKDDTVIDCSQDLLKVLNIAATDLGKVNISEICPEFITLRQKLPTEEAQQKEDCDRISETFQTFSIESDEFESHMENIVIQSTQYNPATSPQALLSQTDRSRTHLTTAIQSPRKLLLNSPVSAKNLASPTALSTHRTELLNIKSEASERIKTKNPLKEGAKAEKFEKIISNTQNIETKLEFYPRDPNLNSRKISREKINFLVKIESCHFGDTFYQVLKFKDLLIDEEEQQLQDKLFDSYNSSRSKVPPLANINNVSSIHDKSLKKIYLSTQNQEDDERVSKELENKQNLKKIKHLLTNQKETASDLDEEELKFKFDKAKTLKKVKIFEKDNHDASSTVHKAYSKLERISKELGETLQKFTLRPSTKFSVLTVYVAMALVLLFICIDYRFSKKSLEDMNKGVDIIDTANYRTLTLVVAWQYSLVIWVRVLGLRPIETGIATNQVRIRDYMTLLTDYNEQLVNTLTDMDYTKLNDLFYSKNINLWVPYTDKTFDEGTVNTFTALNVLTTKYLQMINWKKSYYLLNNDTDFLFILNNTVNDFLIKSQEQLSLAESIVEDIIENNQSLVTMFVVLEILALCCIIIALILVIFKVIKSYFKLFKVLQKIQQSVVQERISNLEYVKEYFAKEIEEEDFTNKMERLLDRAENNLKKPSQTAKNDKYHRSEISLKSLAFSTFKSLFIALTLVFLVMIVIIILYLTSNDTLNSLKTINQRLTVTYRLAFAFDAAFGNFYHVLAFQNQTQFTVGYKPSAEYLNNTLTFLSGANEQLLEVFTEPGKGIVDPEIESFFKSDLCSVINQTAFNSCAIATNGQSFGLLGVNSNYVSGNQYWLNQYLQNTSFANAKQLLMSYVSSVGKSVSVIEQSYYYLRSYLLKSFETASVDHQATSVKLFYIVLTTLLGSTLLIQIFTIKKYKKMDHGIKKVLKVVPSQIIFNNKKLIFYLKREFNNEIKCINELV